MKPAAWRLVVTAVLFAGWIGYLGYLVAATRNFFVLSRPQLLVSSFDVIATRNGDDSFQVDEVLYPASQNEKWRGKTIRASNLKSCKIYSIYTPPTSDGEPVPPDEGRQYLLPLDILEGANVRVVPAPPSPGYKTGAPRIYPFAPPFHAAVLSEYRTIPK